MKHNFFKIVLVLVLTVLSVSISFAQSSANATSTVSATIINPISISKDANMNFGVVVPGGTAGTVLLATDGTRSIGSGGTTILSGQTGSPAVAQFTVSGEPTYTYSISFPASITIKDAATDSMAVNSFVHIATSGTEGTIPAGGSQVLKFGATLNVGAIADQPHGAYTNTTAFKVTVNYN